MGTKYVRVGPAGVQDCSPLWFAKSMPWEDIVDAVILEDLPAFPVVETKTKRVKLYGGMSCTDLPRSAASRTVEAIKDRLRAGSQGYVT